MVLRHVNASDLPRPIGFSHAVVWRRARSPSWPGKTALDSTGAIVGETIVEQFEVALSNLLRALASAGGTPADLAKMTITSRWIRETTGPTPSRSATSGGAWSVRDTRR